MRTSLSSAAAVRHGLKSKRAPIGASGGARLWYQPNGRLPQPFFRRPPRKRGPRGIGAVSATLDACFRGHDDNVGRCQTSKPYQIAGDKRAIEMAGRVDRLAQPFTFMRTRRQLRPMQPPLCSKRAAIHREFSEDTCSPAAPRATSISLASLFAIASAKELKSSTTIRKELGPPITFCL